MRYFDCTLKGLSKRAQIPELTIRVGARDKETARQIALGEREARGIPYHALCDIREVPRPQA